MSPHRRRWAIAAIALAAALAVGQAALAWRATRRPSVPKVQRALARAAIGPGAPAPRVLAVLDSLGTVHSQVTRDNLVTANFGKSWSRWIVYAQVFGTFYFDSAGRLDSLRIEEIATGP